MRLLITLGFPPQEGGMQRYLYQRCLLSPQEMVVAAPGRGHSEVWDRTQPFIVWRWPGGVRGLPGWRRVWQTGWAFAALRHALRHYRVEALELGQALPFGMVGVWSRVHHGLPYTVWAFGDEIIKPAVHPVGRALLLPVLHHADRIIAVSHYTARLVRALVRSRTQVDVLHPWPAPHFVPGARAVARARLHLPPGARVLLTVARLEKRKGVDRVLRALPLVMREVPDLLYLVVGRGPARRVWEQLAASLGVGPRVRWVGHVDDRMLVACYQAADLFVMTPTPGPSEVEGFGMVFVEAAACGLPAVAGVNGGTPEAVLHDRTGLLVFENTEASLAEGLRSLLLDVHRRATMARNAVAYANTLRENAWARVRSVGSDNRR